MTLPLGKLGRKILEENVLKFAKFDDSVLLPPKYGEDGSVIFAGDEIIVSAADPITGATKNAGWLAVHVNANDVAVHAAWPKWFTVILLFPKGTEESKIEDVISGVRRALDEINSNLIGGHTEITDRVNETIISGFMMGVPMVKGRFVTSGGGKEGDAILMTKGAGIEGTYILATDFADRLKASDKLLENARRYQKFISVLPEVRVLVEEVGIDHIHAMHDATEGGLLGAVYEMSMASNTGFEIFEDRILVREETAEICSEMGIDPIRLISSGTLVAALDKEVSEEAINALKKNGIDAEIIGCLTSDKRVVRKVNGEVEHITSDILDELWKLYMKGV